MKYYLLVFVLLVGCFTPNPTVISDAKSGGAKGGLVEEKGDPLDRIYSDFPLTPFNPPATTEVDPPLFR